MVSPELSIVIVNWNSEAHLRECLHSLTLESQDCAFEVTVVDNAATLRDLGCIAAEFPAVHFLQTTDNVGYARANNLGFGAGRRCPYVLFLNPDTRVLKGALRSMVDVLKTTERAGAAGCCLLNSDLSIQTSCIQRYPRILYQALGSEALIQRFPRWKLWGIRPLIDSPSTPVPVEVISGACLMVNSDIFERVGMFSEDYFMYGEDADLCFKIAHASAACFYTSAGRVIHHGGGSSRFATVNTWADVAQCRSKLHFVRKTRGFLYAGLYRAAITTSALVRLTLTGTGAFTQSGSDSERRRRRARKWSAILRWCLRPQAQFGTPSSPSTR